MAFEGGRAILPPKAFIFSTIAILGVEILLLRLKRVYQKEDSNAYKTILVYAIIGAFTFLALQFWGWSSLHTRQLAIDEGLSKSYISILSGLHAVHMLGGIAYLFWMYLSAKKRLKDPMLEIAFYQEPVRTTYIGMTNMYWHFLGGIWYFVLIIMLIMSLNW